MLKRSCALGVLALLLVQPGMADLDVGAPFFGTIRLSGDVEYGPHTVPIMAGGRHRADLIDSQCVGFIQKTSPDLNLDYRGDAPVFIYARSRTDTTLVINGPDGVWRCDDDTMGFDPMVMLRNAPEGVYHIWVGAFTDQAAPAKIRISSSDPR